MKGLDDAAVGGTLRQEGRARGNARFRAIDLAASALSNGCLASSPLPLSVLLYCNFIEYSLSRVSSL